MISFRGIIIIPPLLLLLLAAAAGGGGHFQRLERERPRSAAAAAPMELGRPCARSCSRAAGRGY